MAIVTPLYGHHSEDTAYLVDDYPYGRTVRCRIRYWLECSEGKGFRFVSQTENPKTLRWNAPKKSTYARLGGAMYLDEQNHVQWFALTEYATPEQVKAFVTAFPTAEVINGGAKAITLEKIRYLRQCLDGTAYFTINGIKQDASESELDRKRAELAQWESVATLIKYILEGS